MKNPAKGVCYEILTEKFKNFRIFGVGYEILTEHFQNLWFLGVGYEILTEHFQIFWFLGVGYEMLTEIFQKNRFLGVGCEISGVFKTDFKLIDLFFWKTTRYFKHTLSVCSCSVFVVCERVICTCCVLYTHKRNT